jgi:hypothetical protein
MLVLSRKLGERILVPHCELVFTVLAVDGTTVRVSISAPTEVNISGKKSGSNSVRKSAVPLRKGRGCRRLAITGLAIPLRVIDVRELVDPRRPSR